MSTIQLRTPIPGPRSQALMKRRTAAVVQGAYHATPVFVAKGEGAVVEDVDGNRLIDFAGGIGCLNTGHCAPAVVDAVRRQLDRFLHTSFNVLPYESYIAVCERLNALAPGKGPKKTILVNTGAEAVELAAHGINHSRCSMSGVEAADAARKINQAVAVNIFHDRSFRLGDKDRRGMISPLHNGSIAPLHEGLRARSGNGCAHLNGGHNSVLSSKSSVLSEGRQCQGRFYWQLTTGHCSQYQPIGASFKLMYTCLVSRYSSMPHGPSSRPKPDCL